MKTASVDSRRLRMRSARQRRFSVCRLLPLCLALFFLSATLLPVKPRLYIVGDSTACIYASSLYPRTGWAQVVQRNFITDSVLVCDSALSGRSSKSFYDEGHWTPVKNALRKGDYVIIQFGHNDEKTDDAQRGTLPATTFKQYLSIYVDDAIAKGAIPILATPIERNSWSSATVLKSTHITADGDYPQEIRDLAVAKKVTCIDATKLTKTFLEAIGRDSATRLYMNLAAGEWPNYPNGNTDNTHLQERGAKVIAQLIVDAIARQEVQPLSQWIIPPKTTALKTPSFRQAFSGVCSADAVGIRHGGSEPMIIDVAGRRLLKRTRNFADGYRIELIDGTVAARIRFGGTDASGAYH
jgi:lysophospholipase L1-like esterase